MFGGSIVALVTPMEVSGEIAYKALLDLVEWHITSGTHGLVILGTTGESATLEEEERSEIIRAVVSRAKGRIPVIVGAGSASTQKTIALAQRAQAAGADAVLLVTPYYNRPTQEGLYLHYSAVAQAVSIPQILYNVPARTGTDLLPETVLRLAKYENIVGIKEAVPEKNRLHRLKKESAHLSWLSGDDATAVEFFELGAQGVISVAANILPAECAYLMSYREESADSVLRNRYQQRVTQLVSYLFLETNPIVVKWMLHKLGRIPAGIRLPLTCLDTQYQTSVCEVLQKLFAF